jgi:UDP-N-acetyl-D-mannosaminuronate dehydrogenase
VRGAKVLVLGVAYKRDVADHRESPAIEVILGLKRLGAEVAYHDPLIPSFQDRGLRMESVPLSEDLLASQDLVIVATDHSNFDYDGLVRRAKRVLDTRGATRHLPRELTEGKVVLL